MTTAPISIRQVKLKTISAMREAYRAEQDCQVVHDSIHARRGWTREFAIAEADRVVAYASLAVDGPWRDKPTLYELYADIQEAITIRAGGGEWSLEVAGTAVGKGGLLFHYNPPYADIYMEVDEPHRRRGYGGYLVQELKRLCRELGAVPGARCDPTNAASRRTLQRAGLVPYAHILIGSFRQPDH